MIRKYQPADYALLNSWCQEAGITTLTEEQLPLTTYIQEYEGRPVMSLSLLCPNARELAYLEYFIANPAFKSSKRREMAISLVEYVEDRARVIGYKKLVCLAPNAKLKEYYSSFGYSPNLEGLTLMAKEIG